MAAMAATAGVMGFAPLAPGQGVRIVAPADWLDRAALAAGATALRGMGLDVTVDGQTAERWGRLAGTDGARADALNRAYGDPSVGAILCARGGYGAGRLVDLVDWDTIAANPKPLIGYSDITALLAAIHVRTGQTPWHGPVLNDFAARRAPLGRSMLIAALGGGDVAVPLADLSRTSRVLVPGRATGPLVGGNLSLLAASCGTWWQPPVKGAILMVEDIAEPMYRIDRMLTQLSQAGWFADLAGLIVGTPVDIEQEGEDFPEDFNALIARWFAGASYPVVYDFPCGHGPDRALLPIGGRVGLTATDRGARLTLGG